jgi:hypothetical protein
MTTRELLPQRAGIQCRISDDREGRGLGVQRQEADCRAPAERLGWQVSQVHSDSARAACRGAMVRVLDASQISQLVDWLEPVGFPRSCSTRSNTTASRPVSRWEGSATTTRSRNARTEWRGTESGHIVATGRGDKGHLAVDPPLFASCKTGN